MIYKSTRELVGNTPIVNFAGYSKKHDLKAELLCKVECFNPAGSAKDRVAWNMLADAEERGLISEGATIIEPTSGNTGIGLASACAIKGYKAIIVMPDTMTVERRLLMSAYGAEVVLTDGALGMAGCIAKAQELKEQTPNSFIPDQFSNKANADAHYKTTGPEIWADTEGKIDIFVAGVGTGGTITGTGRFLKEKNPDIKIVGYEPAESPLITKGIAGAHGIQGIGANFVPAVYDESVVDEVMTVETENAIIAAREIAKTEGILVGISSGGAVFAAAELAKRPENFGKRIVVLLPDSGERYLTAGLYE